MTTQSRELVGRWYGKRRKPVSGVTDSLERARPSDRTDEEGGCRGRRPPWRSVVRPARARRDLRC